MSDSGRGGRVEGRGGKLLGKGSGTNLCTIYYEQVLGAVPLDGEHDRLPRAHGVHGLAQVAEADQPPSVHRDDDVAQV